VNIFKSDVARLDVVVVAVVAAAADVAAVAAAVCCRCSCSFNDFDSCCSLVVAFNCFLPGAPAVVAIAVALAVGVKDSAGCCGA